MNKITLDEYIKRRKRGSAVYSSRQDQYGQGMSYGQPTAPQTQLPANQNGQVPVYRPNQWSRPTMVNAPAAVQPETPAIDATKPTDGAGSNVLTWDDQIDLEIQAAAKKVLEVSNRKFQYNSYESPIYSIMRQEYLKEADLAAGRATAAAAQNAGGFGSSFAVMAGEEARRQVMEGFHDQEDELYAAAQSEFEAERASAFDNYLKLRELKAMEQDAKSEAALAASGMTEGAAEASEYLKTTYGMEYSENAMRQDLLSKGYSEADVNAALESQRKMVGSTITDYKAGDIASALGQASALDEAYRTGQLNDEEYKAAKDDNAKIIMSNVKAGMDRIDDVDYEGLGIPEEEWGTMNDSEKKLRVLDEAGRLVKKGIVSHSEYFQIVTNEVKADLNDIAEDVRGGIDKNKDRLSVAVVVQDMYDNGYLYEGAYNYLMFKTILPEMNIKELRDMYKNNETAKQMSYSQDMHDAAAVLLNHYNESETTEEKKTTKTYTGKMTWTR
jgi:hypothetical protein